MFTGLVEEIGKINKIIPGDKVREFIISARKITDGLIIGDSICVNGACLTVETTESNAFKVTAVEETLKRSTLKNFRIGSTVNLERALSFTDRLAGHLVQGHVDDVALVHAINKQGNAWILELALSPVLLRYTIEKGSIAVDGVSLTIAKKRGDLILLAINGR